MDAVGDRFATHGAVEDFLGAVGACLVTTQESDFLWRFQADHTDGGVVQVVN